MSITLKVTEKLESSLLSMSKELVLNAVEYCAERYNFSAEEAYRELGLESLKVERKKSVKSLKPLKEVKSVVSKPSFPLPYNGELKEECCQALRQNNGLYTQCQGERRKDSDYCKGCGSLMQKSGSEVPEYGTIKMRNAVGILEYVDPKGRKPIAYAKIMKKYNLTKEQVLEEAGKQNIVINEEHFVVPEESKRGRPKTVEKESKEKGVRGRPKKSKKVMEIADEGDDLFASLVANANEVEEVSEVKVEDENAEKEQKKAEKEEKLAAEKAEKEQKKEAEKAEKEQKKEAEKAEKEQKKEAERQAREAKKKAEEEEKAAKKMAAEQAKAAKEASKAQKEAAKAQKEAAKAQKEAAKAEKEGAKEVEKKETASEEDEEPDVVKKIEFEGKKYLKSKKTGIIYDYIEYTKNGEQVVVGKWNESSNKIEFAASEEEEEEDYEM
jgi:chemotaxis protein histidine kinase CheA